MATWTTIPDSSLEPGKPIRSIDGLALRDNPVAIAEGQPSAPRIVGKAAKRVNDYPVLTVSASDAFNADNGSNREGLTTAAFSLSDVVGFRYTISTYTGSMRFRCRHQGDTSFPSVLSLYKNNVLIASFFAYSSPASRLVDSSVAPGDVFEWRHRKDFSASDPSILSNCNVFASDAYTTRPLYIAQSEVNNP
jgi:hypothetical protein